MIDKVKAFLKIARTPVVVMDGLWAVEGDNELAIFRVTNFVQMVNSTIGDKANKNALFEKIIDQAGKRGKSKNFTTTKNN